MKGQSNDPIRARRSPADVEALLRDAYAATDDLPIGDASPAYVPVTQSRTARRGWRVPAMAAAAAAAIAGGVLLPGALTGERPDPPLSTAATARAADALWQVSALVLEKTDGPQLCLGAILTSNPPQCGGPLVVGWDWSSVSGYESASGVRWGSFKVVGTYSDPTASRKQGTFTLRRPPVPDPPPPAPSTPPTAAPPSDGRFSTPCPAPPGGWVVVDSAKTGDAAMYRAYDVAAELPNVGDVWIDRRDKSVGTIFNVSVVGAAAPAERQLRKVWGGPLCVSVTKHTHAELQAIHHQIMRSTPGYLSGGDGSGHVEIQVVLDEGGHLQRAFDKQYGAGLVRVTSALTPYSGDSAPTS